MSARVQSRAATPDTRVNQCPVSGSHENSRHGRASQLHCQWPGHGSSGEGSSASSRHWQGGHTNMPHTRRLRAMASPSSMAGTSDAAMAP